MPYMSNWLIGICFATNVVGTIISSPQLNLTSVYAFGGLDGSTGTTDIGPINMTLRNVRTGGPSPENLASANLLTIENSTFIPAINCASLGNVTNMIFYDAWSMQQMTGLIKDANFGQSNKTFLNDTFKFRLCK